MGPLAIAAIGAGIKGLTSFFGSNPQAEAKRKMLEELNQQEQQIKEETARNKKIVQMTAETSKKQRRGIASQNNAARGVDDPTAIFSNEEDIINAQTQGLTDLDAQMQNALNDIRNKRTQVEAMDEGPSAIERGIGGAIEGANMGFGVAGAMGKLTPQMPDPTAGLPKMPANIGAMDLSTMNSPVDGSLTGENPISGNPLELPGTGTLGQDDGLNLLGKKKKTLLSSGDMLGVGDMNMSSVLPNMNYKKSLFRLNK